MKENSPGQGLSPTVTPQEDARWDKAKAETVGRATYEVAEDVAYREDRNLYDGNPFEEESYAYALDADKSQADDIAKLERPFERLYDINPEGFAQVSIPDFISAAEEFNGLELQLAWREQELQRIQVLLSNLQNHLTKKWRYEGQRFAEDLIGIFGHKGSVTGENDLSLRQNMKKISGDFDLTPRQVLEKYIEFATKYVEIATGRAEEAKKEHQQFFEKHKIPEEMSKVIPV